MLKIGAQSCSKNARDNFCYTLSTVHIRIYKVETQVYFCANFLFKSTLHLKPRWWLWKQYKKYPTFPFFYLINCLPAAKTELKKLKQEIWQVPFQRPFEAINVLGLTVFLKFLGTHLTLSNGQKRQSFNKFTKFIEIFFQKCVFNGWWG